MTRPYALSMMHLGVGDFSKFDVTPAADYIGERVKENGRLEG